MVFQWCWSLRMKWQRQAGVNLRSSSRSTSVTPTRDQSVCVTSVITSLPVPLIVLFFYPHLPCPPPPFTALCLTQLLSHTFSAKQGVYSECLCCIVLKCWSGEQMLLTRTVHFGDFTWKNITSVDSDRKSFLPLYQCYRQLGSTHLLTVLWCLIPCAVHKWPSLMCWLFHDMWLPVLSTGDYHLMIVPYVTPCAVYRWLSCADCSMICDSLCCVQVTIICWLCHMWLPVLCPGDYHLLTVPYVTPCAVYRWLSCADCSMMCDSLCCVQVTIICWLFHDMWLPVLCTGDYHLLTVPWYVTSCAVYRWLSCADCSMICDSLCCVQVTIICWLFHDMWLPMLCTGDHLSSAEAVPEWDRYHAGKEVPGRRVLRWTGQCVFSGFAVTILSVLDVFLRYTIDGIDARAWYHSRRVAFQWVP